MSVAKKASRTRKVEDYRTLSVFGSLNYMWWLALAAIPLTIGVTAPFFHVDGWRIVWYSPLPELVLYNVLADLLRYPEAKKTGVLAPLSIQPSYMRLFYTGKDARTAWRYGIKTLDVRRRGQKPKPDDVPVRQRMRLLMRTIIFAFLVAVLIYLVRMLVSSNALIGNNLY